MLAATGSYAPTLGLDAPSQAVETTTPRVLSILSGVLERLVARNDRLLASRRFEAGKSLKGFHGVRAPAISLPKYLERIYKYTGCSPACFVVGYVYIDRLVHRHPDSLVVSLNVHRLLVTSVMVASKVLDDVHYNNAFYARVGGVSNVELNRLEIELLFLLDFGVVVSSGVFESYCLHLEREVLINGLEGMNRIDKALALPNIGLEHVPEIPVGNTTAKGSNASSPPPDKLED
ncbi:cyclin-U1-1 [Punica granatum]|uniref:Uncharacterized protein n=2 Tax=Punica granatum TaxID=22663 RepID=A0A218X1R2_PUNGR|nr:cyclin-U1-1 [Punica granatum]OWM78580.1 hypothetical protein CDL15_Pgr002747 [Punica granatum]PKI68617.1 hypothetical protein CRG98_011021 [Punica granatum]